MIPVQPLVLIGAQAASKAAGVVIGSAAACLCVAGYLVAAETVVHGLARGIDWLSTDQREARRLIREERRQERRAARAAQSDVKLDPEPTPA
jgi:hypothetical protein